MDAAFQAAVSLRNCENFADFSVNSDRFINFFKYRHVFEEKLFTFKHHVWGRFGCQKKIGHDRIRSDVIMCVGYKRDRLTSQIDK